MTEQQSPIGGSVLSLALVSIQGEMPVIGKDRDGFGYRYATLTKILRVVMPILHRHNCALLQPLDNINGEPAIKTIIMHGNGEFAEWIYPLSKAGMAKVNDAQQFGAAITYARRYGLVGALCIPVDDEDDDAACLTEHSEPKPLAKKPAKPAPAIRAGNAYGIPPAAWLKLDACKSYDEMYKACTDLREDSRGANPEKLNWNIALNKFFKDRKDFFEDMEREITGGVNNGRS